MQLRHLLPPRILAILLPTLALATASCRTQPAPPSDDGMIRPELSALPPEARARPANETRPTHPAAAAETWNAQQIDWQRYDAGLAKAKAEKKPVCLVFYTNWCPHCRNYSHVFDDPKVVAQSKRFVMIRANADEEQELAAKYAKDGGYIPRTFFLSADGTLDADIHTPRPKFQYFYDERDPGSLLGGMEEALRKLGG